MNKLLILTVLAIQTASHILAVRYTRSSQSGPLYFSGSVVTSCELLKLVACLFAIFYQSGFRVSLFKSEVLSCLLDGTGFLKILVPGLLYTLQNNLLYVGLSNLPAATYQVLYQMKLLTTALFSYFMLSKRLSYLQWMSLVILFLGVVLVELDGAEEKSNSARNDQKPLLGVLTVAISSISSGFAGVYFERIVKGSKNGNSPAAKSIWLLNVQLALMGILLGVASTLYKDYEGVMEHGFFHGFNGWVCLVVFLQGAGGIIVSMVVKHADNILKGFACAAAILLACFGSHFLFDFEINPQFIMGTICVVGAIFMYSLPPPDSSSKSKRS